MDEFYLDEEENYDEDTQKDMYLSFCVDNKEYGIDISRVLEIIVLPSITEVPDMPIFVKGVINLRGKVIPVIDVRSRFSVASIDYNDRTCVIIVDSGQYLVGLIVDAVDEVIKITKDQIEPAPKIGDSFASRFIDSMGKFGDSVIIMINLEKLLSDEERNIINDASFKNSSQE